MKINRKRFSIYILAISIAILIISCGGGIKFNHVGKRVIVLGIDGMDPNLLRNFMDRGVLPNLTRLADTGTLLPLTTSQPPQSPVAWSNFITGMDPGGHGVFDFIHRDPATRIPFLSTSGMKEGSKVLKLGKYRIPLKGGEALNLRKGKAFWQVLETNGIPGVIFKLPANFPPTECEWNTFAGMGTPDMLGSYGIFTYITDDSSLYQENIAGGKIEMVEVVDGYVKAEIGGPVNTFLKDAPQTFAAVDIYIDPMEDNVRIVVDNQDIILRPNEWGNWVELKFNLLKPIASASGIVRFYLKKVHPNLELYCSPVNINPANPALPLSTPTDYSKKLADNLGSFYTLGIPEDNKALSAGYFNYDDYLSQAKLVLQERLEEFEYTWKNFDDGFYFFYFSSLDQNSHMLWSTFDRESPLYYSENEDKYGLELMNFYIEIDKVIGKVLDDLGPNDVLMIMSDHGFAPFRYCFDLNTWLLDNGYITLRDTTSRDQEFFPGVNWRKTQAYGLGINSLYLNVRGRENNGPVKPGEDYEELRDELIDKLTSIIDPKTGEQVITHVWKREDIYHGDETKTAPDLIVGYNRGYRSSWDTILGKFPHHIISDNPDKWSGDHCIDNQFVPGVFMSNKKADMDSPALYDLAPTILSEFGVAVPDYMKGKPIFN